uniref:Protein TIC 22-like, chloroplastic n=1 Tax=Fagus sylvatica TaxID=28930 RepID=A0A2N9EK69_FAGSY
MNSENSNTPKIFPSPNQPPQLNLQEAFSNIQNHCSNLLQHLPNPFSLQTHLQSAFSNLQNHAKQSLDHNISAASSAKNPFWARIPEPNKTQFAAPVRQSGGGGGGVGSLSNEVIDERLAGVPVYALSNGSEEFVLVSGKSTNKSLGLFCFKKEDAEALLAQIKNLDPDMQKGSKVVAVALNKVVQLKLNGVAFRLIPESSQVKNALTEMEKIGISDDGFSGVPVFQLGMNQKGLEQIRKPAVVAIRHCRVRKWQWIHSHNPNPSHSPPPPPPPQTQHNPITGHHKPTKTPPQLFNHRKSRPNRDQIHSRDQIHHREKIKSTAKLEKIGKPGRDWQTQAKIGKPRPRSASSSPFPTTTLLTTTTLSTTTFPTGKLKPVSCFNRKPKEKREHREKRSKSLILKSQNKSYRPAFFRKEDLENSLRRAAREQNQINPAFRRGDIQVAVLEDVLKGMKESSTSKWDDIVFIPPGFDVSTDTTQR